MLSRHAERSLDPLSLVGSKAFWQCPSTHLVGHFLKSVCVTLSFYPSARTLLRAPLAITSQSALLSKTYERLTLTPILFLSGEGKMRDPGNEVA